MNRQNKIYLLFFDLIVLVGTLVFVAYWRDGASEMRVLSSMGLWFISASVLLLFYVFGAYDLNASISARRVFARSVLSLGIALAAIIVINYFVAKERTGVFGRSVLVGSFIIFGTLASIYRILLISLLKKVLQRSRWLFICTQRIWKTLAADLEKNHFHGQKFFLLDKNTSETSDSVVGTWDQFTETAKSPWNQVILALDNEAPQELIEKLISIRFENIGIKDLIQFYEQEWKKIPLYALEPDWFLHTEGFNLFGNPIRVRLKRLIDIVTSIVLLIFTLPLMLLTMIAIKLESPGPAIYRQIRTGRNGREFTLLKFRSMRQDAESDGAKWASRNDSRITKVGSFIRKTRLDELPQLINILEGSMSLVGPRPERPEFNHLLSEKIPFYQFRHLIHPGLTGWAQVLYPYGASIEDAEEKLQYELFYIKNYSLWFDISILLKTVQVVLFGKGR